MPKHDSSYYALLPAAGKGSRFGSERPKQYLPLAGLPLIAHSLAVFHADPRIARIFVALDPADDLWAEHDWSPWAGRLTPLYCGGATRAESVANGLAAMRESGHGVAEGDWVLVHDAARPCLSAAALDRLIVEAGRDAVGGILAVPVADTLKRGDGEGRIAATVAREGLWQAQTPQMFRLGLLRRALEQASAVTDEAGAIEALGLRPRLILGAAENFKVTWPGDFALAERLLPMKKGM